MCWHKYEKWKNIEVGEIKRKVPGYTPITIGTFIVQTKTCLKCGKTQIRRVEVKP